MLHVALEMPSLTPDYTSTQLARLVELSGGQRLARRHRANFAIERGGKIGIRDWRETWKNCTPI